MTPDVTSAAPTQVPSSRFLGAAGQLSVLQGGAGSPRPVLSTKPPAWQPVHNTGPMPDSPLDRNTVEAAAESLQAWCVASGGSFSKVKAEDPAISWTIGMEWLLETGAQPSL